MNFLTGIFQFNCKNEPKQVKWNKIKRNMRNLDAYFLIYKYCNFLFQWLLNLFFDKVYDKNEW